MEVGEGIEKTSSNWDFEDISLDDFEKHISKSVPCYHLTHKLGLELSDFFCKPNTNVFDIGSTSGSFINSLLERHNDKDINFNGIEISTSMYSQSVLRYPKINFYNEDVRDCDLHNSSFISSYYTIQFINPQYRQKLINKIFESLNWGGGFLMFEKVRAPDARFQDYMIQIYNEFKLSNEFTPSHIMSKSRSLKGVLEPFSTAANIEMLQRAGFKDIMTVYKYISFEGFLAIK
tara:strand:+ start:12378 stop:13076 length:699 start_codon:yes stop_codon:yes gene_type:complete